MGLNYFQNRFKKVIIETQRRFKKAKIGSKNPILNMQISDNNDT
jgi:hypothetical protein